MEAILALATENIEEFAQAMRQPFYNYLTTKNGFLDFNLSTDSSFINVKYYPDLIKEYDEPSFFLDACRVMLMEFQLILISSNESSFMTHLSNKLNNQSVRFLVDLDV